MAKTFYWVDTVTKKQKLGEQMGLNTPVVLTINDGY